MLALHAHERLWDVRPRGSGSSLGRSIALEPRLREPAEGLLAQLSQGRTPQPVVDYAEGVTLRWLWGDMKRLVTILKGRPGAYPTRLQGIRELFERQAQGTNVEAWRHDDRGPQSENGYRELASCSMWAGMAGREIVRARWDQHML